MTAEPHIDYEALAQGAMRAVVRTVLTRVAETGLPGEHHFYIAFNTRAPGVSLSPRLKERYPEEMTVVLQHRFWDLMVTADRFEVNLTFDSIPERLVVPFTAIKVFFDPSVPYGLQFEDGTAGDGQKITKHGDDESDGDAEAPDAPEIARVKPRAPALVRPERKPRAPRKTAADKAGKGGDAPQAPEKEAPAAEEAPDVPADPGPKVVKLDAFRKK